MSDGTFFFNRTVYIRHMTPVPECFLRLDRHFGAKGLTEGSGIDHPAVALAENLCRRMGNVDFYAESIEATLASGADFFHQTPVIGALLVAHFGACKSVLDAAAVSLNEVFGLGRQGGECDLKKDGFWRSLAGTNSVTATHHKQLRPWILSVVEWRDAAVHRVTPLTMTSQPRDSQGNLLPWTVQLCLAPNVDNHGFARHIRARSTSIKWGHPLHFHRLWRDNLVALCDDVCIDIATIV
jgi:hypothetical protein